jgi:hypothetical protein
LCGTEGDCEYENECVRAGDTHGDLGAASYGGNEEIRSRVWKAGAERDQIKGATVPRSREAGVTNECGRWSLVGEAFCTFGVPRGTEHSVLPKVQTVSLKLKIGGLG